MHAIFLTVFLLGLLLAVFAMLHGVERRGAPAGGGAAAQLGAHGVPLPAAPEPARAVSLPVLAAFAVVFGATGYLLTRSTSLDALPRLAIAGAVGIAGAFGAAALVARWAIAGAEHEVVDERYVLQGHLARVSRAIDAAVPGEIIYDLDGTPHAARALSVDGSPVEAETDVVIERVEDGVAYVEPWARVEKRL